MKLSGQKKRQQLLKNMAMKMQNSNTSPINACNQELHTYVFDEGIIKDRITDQIKQTKFYITLPSILDLSQIKRLTHAL